MKKKHDETNSVFNLCLSSLKIVKLEEIILTAIHCNSVDILVHMSDGSVSIVQW